MIRASGGPVNPRRAHFLISCCVLIAALQSALVTTRTIANAAATTLKTRAVVLIVLDGLRWQEVFTGAEHDLMDAKHGNAQDATQLRKNFWRDTPEASREA